MTIPFIDLKRFEPDFLDRWIEKIRELSVNTRFMGGPEIEQLEKSLAQDCGVSHAIGCANGTDALQLALRAAGVGPGDVVLLPDFTFWATFEAIVNVGGRPVTVDVSPDDLQLDFDLFVRAVEEHKARFAMVVHLYGWGSARLAQLRQFCKEKKVTLVEDGAQAYGVSYQGRSIYQDAEISTISFYPAKVFGAAGDAGAVLTSNPEFAARIRSMANHGRSDHYSYQYVGWNSRIDTLQAAYLNLVHEHLDRRLESRRNAAAFYREKLSDCNSFRCATPPDGYVENGYLNVLVFEPGKRADAEQTLKDNGIGFGIVYPGAMSDQEASGPVIAGRAGGDVARDMASRVLSLPLFAYMTEDELEQVVSVVQNKLG